MKVILDEDDFRNMICGVELTTEQADLLASTGLLLPTGRGIDREQLAGQDEDWLHDFYFNLKADSLTVDPPSDTLPTKGTVVFGEDFVAEP